MIRIASIMILTAVANLLASQASADQVPQGHNLSTSATSADTAIRAKWAQLVSGPTGNMISVRAVLHGTNNPCEGVFYRDPANAQQIEGVEERHNSAPNDFEITVCEARLIPDIGRVYLRDGSVVRWSPQLRSIAVIGDTGCRYPEKDQGCSSDSWPFARVVEALRKKSPDVVVHVGDYRYHGNQTKEQKEANPDSKPDTWPNWQHDFFVPARGLLESSLWVMARGNHDNCFEPDDKGAGWLLLLSPFKWTHGCEDASQNKHRETPYALELDTTTRLVVLDTANAVQGRDNWIAEKEKFEDYLDDVAELMSDADGKSVSLLSHFPVLNVEEDEQRAAHVLREEVLPLVRSAPNVEVILSGDIHQFQVLGMVDEPGEGLTRPIQFVAGNGGALLVTGYGPDVEANPCPDEARSGLVFGRIFPGIVVRGRGRCAHGYMLAERNGELWSFFLGEPPSTRAGTAVSSVELICQLDEESETSCSSLPEPDELAKLEKLRRTAAAPLDEKPEYLVGKAVINHVDKTSWEIESVDTAGEDQLVVVRSGGVGGYFTSRGMVPLRDMWRGKDNQLHMPAPVTTE